MVELKPLDGTSSYIWKCLPSIPAAAVFLALFASITSAHCWRMVKTGSWFCIAFAIGGLFQVIGYGSRIWSHYFTNQLAPYAVQSSFIVLAPIFYAASIYMVLGRLIRSVNGERFSTIRTTRMTKVFVAGDILALNVQGNAAGLTVKQSTQKIGQAIITVGLFIQLILFGLFVTAAVVFHKRMRREVGKGPELRPDVPWRQGLKMLYTCSALIIVRSIFRIVEYTMGPDGYPLSHEWPAYTFDGSLMLAVQIIFVVWYPDKFQTRQSDIELTMMRLVSNEQ